MYAIFSGSTSTAETVYGTKLTIETEEYKIKRHTHRKPIDLFFFQPILTNEFLDCKESFMVSQESAVLQMLPAEGITMP
jgi:hypothetical protein